MKEIKLTDGFAPAPPAHVDKLIIYLEAAKEALFAYQCKSRNTIENLEEELLIYKRDLDGTKAELRMARENIRLLQVALMEMQEDKRKLQMHFSISVDDINSKNTEEIAQLKQRVEGMEKELENKMEENIKLQMTVLQIEEELSKDCNNKEMIIIDRNKYIEELEDKLKALSELQLKKEDESEQTLSTSSSLEEILLTENEVNKEYEKLEQLSVMIEQQQKEIQNLRTENHELKLKLGGGRGKQINKPVNEGTTSDESSAPELDNNHLWKRLKEAENKVYEAEIQADNLNYLLNYKIIEINKLQLTLSNQTKEFIQLEEAYNQLMYSIQRNRRGSLFSNLFTSPKLNGINKNSSSVKY